jgi:4-hydroxy-tetrahydrodipicolinate synthase
MTSEIRQRLKGVFTALVTPFASGEIDLAAFERHIEAQLAAGIAGLVPVGTTGEAATLTDAETAAVIRTTVKTAQGRAFVLAGAGSNATRIAIDKARQAADAGVDGLLVVTPYYNKPSIAGLEDHFAAIADAVDLPIMLYSVPGRTGIAIAAESAGRLAADHPNIVGIKEAGGNVERVTELRRAAGEDFVIHSGDDALTLAFLAMGADGVTSVASNAAPAEMVQLVAAWQAGDHAEALRLHRQLSPLFELLFIESNPAPVKAMLELLGRMPGDLRAPLAPVQPHNLDQIRAHLGNLQIAG